MLRILLLLVCSLLIGIKCNYFGDLFKCNDELLKCQESEVRLGKFNEITDGYNGNCSREIGAKWSNITSCELEAIICLINQMKGLKVNCENIADVMHL
ncbi:uncharacterized protein LOC110179995 [Drosophila serrata]|uniref:uncharacterized protein LOC110179995 n=1 Tax=Drosophila serrata TaxID=7274 RepID=UPI000A1D1B49|nr:uncharacterized protein LOC110179995 [Drosophila serrata]